MTCRLIAIAALCAGIGMLAACEETGDNSPSDAAAHAPVSTHDPVQIDSDPWFEDATAESGIEFTWASGHDQAHLLPEIVGGGVALFDMDDDGDLDCYIVQGGSLTDGSSVTNRLYRNDGTGSFTDVTDGSGSGDTGYGMGVACGDYDNDGDTDLYITNVGANVLLRNDGTGIFEDVTDIAGVGDSSMGASATWFDAESDGDLDLFVTNYVNWSPQRALVCYNDRGQPDYCAPNNYQATSTDVFFRNNGDGTFQDVTTESGVASATGNGLGVVAADFTGDGHIDVFVANDANADRLWVNNGEGGLTDEASFYNCAFDTDGKAKAGMGVTIADVDDDRDFDLLVCNLRNETDSFYLNENGAYFVDRTTRAGLGAASRPFTRFGMGLIDFNHDGRFDLFQANGKVMAYDDGVEGDPYAEPNLLLIGGEDGRFERAAPANGIGAAAASRTSRGAAYGDIDGDGDIDIVVINRDGPARVMRNTIADNAPGSWLIVDVRNADGAPALNASVTLVCADATRTRLCLAGYSYLASNDPRAHFGLPQGVDVHELIVRWPDGHEVRINDVAVGTIVRLDR